MEKVEPKEDTNPLQGEGENGREATTKGEEGRREPDGGEERGASEIK